MTKPIYEDVTSIQMAINKAAATGQVVRFILNKSNEEIRNGIVDKKGCKLMKKDRESNDVAVIPPGVEDFDFEDVDTTLTLSSDGLIRTSSGLILLPD